MPLPVISVAQMREWEKATWASGQTEESVIRQAGQAVAARAETLTRPGDFVLILVGKGHNGDDAAQAARAISGREVKVLRISEPQSVEKELEKLLEPPPDLVIDGLFGIGLNRPLAASWLKLIQRVNACNSPILAVDVPSGISADTGEPLEDAIRATHTITFGAVKQGLIKSIGWPFVGRLEVAQEIGLLEYPFGAEINWCVEEDFVKFLRPRSVAGHKGAFGHVAIIAGSQGYHGAAVLAARGAQRAQPGLVTLLTAENVYVPIASQLQAVMVDVWQSPLRLPETTTAVVVGPGLAAPNIPAHVRTSVEELWTRSRLPIVADASALEWLPKGNCPALAIRVITPHPGEAARLLQGSIPGILQDRPATLRRLSREWGGTYVVLKSHQTMVGKERDELYINCSGNPGLAQGGSGDLLAGYLGGLLAQPDGQDKPAATLRFGVWQHGATADQLSRETISWSVEDLANRIGAIVARKGAQQESPPIGSI